MNDRSARKCRAATDSALAVHDLAAFGGAHPGAEAHLADAFHDAGFAMIMHGGTCLLSKWA